MSLRRYLYGLLLALLLTTGVGAGAVFVYFSQQSAMQLGERLQEQTMTQVQQQLRQYIHSAVNVNRLNKSLYEQGLIGLDDITAWARQFDVQAKQFEGISYITVSQFDGVWFSLDNSVDKQFIEVDSQQNIYKYSLGVEGSLNEKSGQHESPVLPADTGVLSEVRAGKSQWSDIHSPYSSSSLAISHGITADRNGQPRATFSISLSLQQISRFLKQFSPGARGSVHIVDKNMNMVASSTLHTLFSRENGKIRRVAARDYGDDVFADVVSTISRQSSRELFGQETSKLIKAAGERVSVLSQPFFTADGLDWLVITVIPVNQLLEGVLKATLWALGGGFLLIILALWVASIYANRWTRPLSKLANRVSELQWLNLNQDFDMHTNITEVRELSEALTHMQTGLQSFTKYVPRDLVRQILLQGTVAQLGGEQRHVSVMFADIEGYSSAVEKAEPEHVLTMLNQYFTAMQKVISLYGGTLIEQLGDGMLIVFGAPHVLQQHAVNATRCALDMHNELTELNRQWKGSDLGQSLGDVLQTGLSMRIGIHSGHVIAGNIGGHEHIKYGVVGDVVNVAARIEGLNKSFASSIAISGQVYNRLEPATADMFKSQGHQSLKGREQEQLIYTCKVEA